MIFTLNHCYLFKPDPTEIARKKAQKAAFTVIDDYHMDFLKNEKIAKFLYVKPDMDYLKSVGTRIYQRISKNSFQSVIHHNRYLEFNPLGVSKGAAIEMG